MGLTEALNSLDIKNEDRNTKHEATNIVKKPEGMLRAETMRLD